MRYQVKQSKVKAIVMVSEKITVTYHISLLDQVHSQVVLKEDTNENRKIMSYVLKEILNKGIFSRFEESNEHDRIP